MNSCIRPPAVVTEPTTVVVLDSSAGKLVTAKINRAYSTFWRAISDLNFTAAQEITFDPEEHRLAEALGFAANGHLATAESLIVPLLDARDSTVARAARVSYGALLSERADWAGLAELAKRQTGDLSPDEAGVEKWASAFAEIKTTSDFTDTTIILPLSRTNSGAPLVSVTVNGVTKQFWLDTGSSLSIIATSITAQCGIIPLTDDTLEFLSVVGRVPAQPTVIRALDIGGLRVTNAPAMIVDSQALTLRSGRRFNERVTVVDGIIGFDIIRQLDLTIDDAGQRIIIRRPVLRSFDPRRPRNLMWFGVPIVSAVGQRGAVLHFSLDTGAEETFGTIDLVQKTRARAVSVERTTLHGFGGETREVGYLIPTVQLTVGRTRLRLHRVFLYDAQYPTIFTLDGTLGADVGRGTAIRIDMTNGRVDIGDNWD